MRDTTVLAKLGARDHMLEMEFQVESQTDWNDLLDRHGYVMHHIFPQVKIPRGKRTVRRWLFNTTVINDTERPLRGASNVIEPSRVVDESFKLLDFDVSSPMDRREIEEDVEGTLKRIRMSESEAQVFRDLERRRIEMTLKPEIYVDGINKITLVAAAQYDHNDQNPIKHMKKIRQKIRDNVGNIAPNDEFHYLMNSKLLEVICDHQKTADMIQTGAVAIEKDELESLLKGSHIHIVRMPHQDKKPLAEDPRAQDREMITTKPLWGNFLFCAHVPKRRELREEPLFHNGLFQSFGYHFEDKEYPQTSFWQTPDGTQEHAQYQTVAQSYIMSPASGYLVINPLNNP